MKKQEIHIIKSQGSLQRIKDLLDVYTLFDINNEDAFLLYGYKTLHPGCKETYRVLKNHQKSLKTNPVKISLDLLGIELGTSIDTQADRIRELEKHELIVKHRHMYECNTYQILQPLPDITFVDTLKKLIYRRDLGNLIYEVTSLTDPREKIDKMLKIKMLVNKGAYHPDIHKIDNALLLT